MINFRYHVVSLAAVFLALAIGLVVGTAALNGPAADDLEGRVSDFSADNQQQRERIDELTNQLDNQEEYAVESAAYLLTEKLAGRRPLVLSIEDKNDDVDKYIGGVLDMLKVSGARVAAQVKIKESFTQPANKDTLLDLARTAAPPAVSGALPANGNGVETSAALLAAVLVGKPGAPPVDGARSVLSAYESQDFIDVSGEVTATADSIIVVAGQPYVDKSAGKERNARVLTIVSRFDQAGPVVVGVGSGSGEGNLARAVRDDPALTKTVSTVDNIATPSGRLVTVLALVEQVGGRVGHYGNSPGAASLMPKPASVRDGT